MATSNTTEPVDSELVRFAFENAREQAITREMAPLSPGAERIAGVAEPAIRGAFRGVGGLASGVQGALETNPLLAGPAGTAMALYRKLTGQETPNLAMMADRLATRIGVPLNETPGQELISGTVAGGVAGAPFGPAAILPGAVSGFVGQGVRNLDLQPAEGLGIPEGIANLLPDLADVLAAAAGGATALGQARVRGPRPARTARRTVERIASNEPTTAQSLLDPQRSGLETLAARVEKPLANALGVKPTDARQTLSAIDQQIKSTGEALYPVVHGPPENPTLVFVTPRIRGILENPAVRRAVESQRAFMNESVKASGEQRPPVPPVYDMKGRVAAEAVPLELLDKVKQGFDLVESKAPTAKGAQRVVKRDVALKVKEIRTAADEQLAAQGRTDWAEARRAIAALEEQREGLMRGLDIFRPSEKGPRGERVPQTSGSIQQELGSMSPEAVNAYRQGVYTAAKERLTTRGVPPDVLNKLRVVLPPGANINSVVRAIRAGQTELGLLKEAGSEPPAASKAGAVVTGGLEAATGIRRRGLFHILQAVIEKPADPQAQAALQKYLISPEGAGELRRLLAQRDVTAVRGFTGAGIPR